MKQSILCICVDLSRIAFWKQEAWIETGCTGTLLSWPKSIAFWKQEAWIETSWDSLGYIRLGRHRLLETGGVD